MRVPTSFRRTIAYRLLELSSRSTSHTGTTTIAPVSRMRPTWLDVAKPEFDDLSRGADRLGKQRRRVEAESLENDPDDKRDDNQPQGDHRRRSAENRATALVMPDNSDQPIAGGRAAGKTPNVRPSLGLIDQAFGNCTIDEGFGWEDASASPPTSLPLIVRWPCERRA